MLIALIGESCTGKSTLAQAYQDKTQALVYSGKDYLNLAKSESEAKLRFKKLLVDYQTKDHMIYIITEKDHLDLLPEGATKVLVTANLATIKSRFAQRMNGVLPPPVVAMLERKHGMFNELSHDLHLDMDQISLEEAVTKLMFFNE